MGWAVFLMYCLGCIQAMSTPAFKKALEDLNHEPQPGMKNYIRELRYYRQDPVRYKQIGLIAAGVAVFCWPLLAVGNIVVILLRAGADFLDWSIKHVKK